MYKKYAYDFNIKKTIVLKCKLHLEGFEWFGMNPSQYPVNV